MMLLRGTLAALVTLFSGCSSSEPQSLVSQKEEKPDITASGGNPNTDVAQVLHVDIPFSHNFGEGGKDDWRETFFRCYYLVPPVQVNPIARPFKKEIEYDFREAKLLNEDGFVGFYGKIVSQNASENAIFSRVTQTRDSFTGLILGAGATTIALVNPFMVAAIGTVGWFIYRTTESVIDGKAPKVDIVFGSVVAPALVGINVVRLPQQAALITHAIRNPEANQATDAVLSRPESTRVPLEIRPLPKKAVDDYVKQVREHKNLLRKERIEGAGCPQASHYLLEAAASPSSETGPTPQP